MLSPFYNFLATRVLRFLQTTEIKPGDKFHIQFEKKEQVTSLYNALATTPSVQAFIYKTKSNENYQTFCIKTNQVTVIIAATNEEITPDFLTHLRNKVGTSQEDFENTAIIFIHDTSLDSLIKGSVGFHQEGMPFHVKSITKDLKKQIKESKLSLGDREILYLNIKKKDLTDFEDSTSIFEYEEILSAIYSQHIDPLHYRDFGLFRDSQLPLENDQNQIRRRLEENFELYNKVDKVHKYGNPDQDLEKYFDEKGISKLKEQTWTGVEYKVVKFSADNRKAVKPIAYIESSIYETSQGVVYWERPDGTSTTKSRIRHIMVFNNKYAEEINLTFSFDGFLKAEFLKVEQHSNASGTISGKKIKLKIKPIKGQTDFSKVTYKDEYAKFEFRVCIVAVQKEIFDAIKGNYTIIRKPSLEVIAVNSEEDLVINPSGDNQIFEEIVVEGQIVELENLEEQLILKMNVAPNDEDISLTKFSLKVDNSLIPLGFREGVEKPKIITGANVRKLKFELKESFQLRGENKLIQGTTEYFTREEFRRDLEKERTIIESGAEFFKDSHSGLEPIILEIDPRIKLKYNALIKYYQINKLLPSLAYLDKELSQLCLEYVNTYYDLLCDLKNGSSLSQQEKNLIKIGTIENIDGDQEILFTPLHPINVAYHLLLNQKVQSERLTEDLMKRLNSLHLIPYIYHDDGSLYKPVEQSHSPEWAYYANNKMQRYKGSRDFVAKLVSEKIEEFVDHFSYLFELAKNAPIKINLINLGDCKEVLQGIFGYYRKKIYKSKRLEELLPIELRIYSKVNISNSFEEFSFYDDPHLIRETFGVNVELSDSDDFDEVDLLSIFREKVHFYTNNSEQSQFEYCHICFYEMDRFIEVTNSKMADIATGISNDGLISGTPTVYVGNAYKTGFGTKYINTESNLLIDLAVQMNALARVARSLDLYNDEECIVTAIAEENKSFLDGVYDSSHWVTFIEPHVSLDFFKNELIGKDLLIIHYSDQYTSSSGYDAITVTRKSKQYQQIIEGFLLEKSISNSKQSLFDIINFFNAVNGDWLLRLISNMSQFPREKISILSAIKVSLAYLDHPEIIWVPISLEEILRVSGGAGLKQKDGLFSAKNLGEEGQFSDDLLLVGIEAVNETIKVHYYPIEVKIGDNPSGVIEKAIEQARKTRKLIQDHLTRDNENVDFTNTVYRNFIMQMVLLSAEKMQLYQVWPERNWNRLTDVLREKLLNDHYEISTTLDKYIGLGAVISFKKNVYFKRTFKQNDILILELTEQDGYNMLTQNIEDLKQKVAKGESDLDQDLLLSKNYIQPSSKFEYANQDQIKKLSSHPKIAEVKINNFETQGTIDQPMEILFGHLKDKKPVYWYPTSTNKVMHTNTGIIGTMGTGKTQFTKSLIMQLNGNSMTNVNKTPIGILIFDYKGDYVKEEFTKVTGAKVYKPYHLPYNPLALCMTDAMNPLLPLHTANSIKETISTAFGLGVKQETLLREVIMEAYEAKGIRKADPSTWNLPAPTLSNVYKVYANREDIKEDSLYAALTNLFEFEIFEPDSRNTKPLFDIIEGITVINLSGYDEGIQNLVVAITLDVFYNQMQIQGHSIINGNYREITRMILVDEADNFLTKDFKSLKKILKEGREFGVGTILSTQLLSHFSTAGNDYANYILTWIVHNTSDIYSKDVKYIFNTQSKNEEENILTKIKSLEKHYSILKQGGNSEPILMRDMAFWELVKEL
ncbi:DNA phosphorothioation-dependent restriction protein DptH [Desulfitobacterium metallireducens]|uniref:Helicase HerA central domain-containing protein n=1 Tax=Desulfitobacterium metallireducens DSM 15288 TaxID=871968 RepID=W0EAG3_9FIRM|nr:DNA phosphorothioation-dependent restriction protein DptH [Desulfitobacterium metallireducens]AHF06056.1 hypothetical protein DESME_02505 [Desulfitobacterium metallireducens DSM 15288]